MDRDFRLTLPELSAFLPSMLEALGGEVLPAGERETAEAAAIPRTRLAESA